MTVGQRVSVFVLLGCCVSNCAAQTFHSLGFLPGADETYANAVSSDGNLVFGGSGVSDGPYAMKAIQWSAASGISEHPQVQVDHQAIVMAASANGDTLVGQLNVPHGDTSEFEAFKWTAAGGVAGLGNLEGGAGRSFAAGVSSDGGTVVGFGTVSDGSGGNKSEAFRWTESGGMIGLGFLRDLNDQSYANAISGDGSIVVGFSSRFEMQGEFQHSVHEAFRWTSETGMVGLGDLPGGESFSFADAISSDGKVIVGHSWGEYGTEAVRWTEQGGLVGLGMLPGQWGGSPSSAAYAVSADGNVIVGVSSWEAAIWDPQHGFRAISSLLMAGGVDLTGWHLEQAHGVSVDGLTIVGYGTNPDGLRASWVATIPASFIGVPEPNALWLVASGTLLVCCRSCKARRSSATWIAQAEFSSSRV